MKITTSLLFLSLAVTAGLQGCATQPKLSNEQIFSQYQQVHRLDSELQHAKTSGAELLAPESYAKAKDALSRAMAAAANNGEGEDPEVTATEGLRAIEKVNQNLNQSQDILKEVIKARDRANAAGANTLQAEKFSNLDADLKSTAILVENGDLEQAKKLRPKLVSGYSNLELEALKQGTVDLAKSAINSAKQQKAEKYAPKTLSMAEEELALAVSILDADRTQTDKADMHAKKTKWLAEQSASIAETVKDFDRRDYTQEDIVLWHQLQLASINEPIGGNLPFNEPGDKVVLGLQNTVANLVSERKEALAMLQRSEQQAQMRLKEAEEKNAALSTVSGSELSTIRAQYETQIANLRKDYEERLALNQKERQALERKDKEEQQKFESVQAMFDPKEATVYRQRKNVLISAHGFQFPPGQSEIQAGNFPLMNKIIRAIKTFPNARIDVSGHTDATGDDTINQSLSESRAEKVAKFLTEVGEVTPDKVSSHGFGQSRPVASNKTLEGRAENRRVEIAIINE